MKKKDKKLRAFELVLNAHHIHRPISNKKALLRIFSERTKKTVQINEVIDTAKLLIAIRQSTFKKEEVPG